MRPVGACRGAADAPLWQASCAGAAAACRVRRAAAGRRRRQRAPLPLTAPLGARRPRGSVLRRAARPLRASRHCQQAGAHTSAALDCSSRCAAQAQGKLWPALGRWQATCRGVPGGPRRGRRSRHATPRDGRARRRALLRGHVGRGVRVRRVLPHARARRPHKGAQRRIFARRGAWWGVWASDAEAGGRAGMQWGLEKRVPGREQIARLLSVFLSSACARARCVLNRWL